jgi:hypothetical protein
MRRVEREPELSAEVERELRALDDALAGRPVDAELEGVARLARELRAERPEPGPALGERLDRWVDAGFGESTVKRAAAGGRAAGRAEGAGRFERLRKSWAATGLDSRLAGAGAVAAVLVAIVIAVSALPSLTNTASDDADTSGGAASPVDAAESQSLDAAPPGGRERGGEESTAGADQAQSAPADIAPIPPSSDLAPGAAERKVERAATLTLSTEPDGVREVSDRVIDVTDDYDGIVVSSNVSERADGDSIGRLELAVPSARLQDFLAEVSSLAEVESRTDSSLDVTEPFVSTRERLREAKAEREGLLTQLADPESAAEAESLRKRLRIVRNRIAAVRAQLAELEQRTDLARVSVTVSGKGSAGTGGWTLGDAIDDALDVLRALGGGAIVAAAVLLPLGLLVAAIWLLTRGARRRARERALDEG